MREPVSVVIASFNRARLLPGTLASVCAALQGEDEILVVDDGSTDGTVDAALAPGAPWASRLRLLAEPHRGAGFAFNAGIRAARHDLVAFADSDDLWRPWRLDAQVPVLSSRRDLVYCFSEFAHAWADGRHEPRWLVQWSGDARPWDEILAPGIPYAQCWPVPASVPEEMRGFRVHVGSMHLNQLRRNYMSVNTLIARRSLANGQLRFGEDLPRLADWECYARLSGVGDGAFLDLETAVQVAHDGPRVSQSGRLAFLQARLAIVERTWAAEPAFMAAHGAEVQALVETLRQEALRMMIRGNRREEARRLLPRVTHAWQERLALSLPPAILTLLVELLDLVEKWS